MVLLIIHALLMFESLSHMGAPFRLASAANIDKTLSIFTQVPTKGIGIPHENALASQSHLLASKKGWKKIEGVLWVQAFLGVPSKDRTSSSLAKDSSGVSDFITGSLILVSKKGVCKASW